MEEVYINRVLKETEAIFENIQLLSKIENNGFNELTLQLLQSWSGEAADLFIIKCRQICEDLNLLKNDIDKSVEELTVSMYKENNNMAEK